MKPICTFISGCRVEVIQYENGGVNMGITGLNNKAIDLMLGVRFYQYASSTLGECYFASMPDASTDWDTQGESHAG